MTSVSNPSSEIEEEENLVTCCNFPLEMVLPNNETGAHIPIPLHAHAANNFLPPGRFRDPQRWQVQQPVSAVAVRWHPRQWQPAKL